MLWISWKNFLKHYRPSANYQLLATSDGKFAVTFIIWLPLVFRKPITLSFYQNSFIKDHTFMTSTWKGVGGSWNLSRVCGFFYCFQAIDLLSIFTVNGAWGGCVQKLVIFADIIYGWPQKTRALNWMKI